MNEEEKPREGNARGPARRLRSYVDGIYWGEGGADWGFVGFNLSRRSASPRPTSRSKFQSAPAGIIIAPRISRTNRNRTG